jgi:tetratricopeptide (TPR) repeat protein
VSSRSNLPRRSSTPENRVLSPRARVRWLSLFVFALATFAVTRSSSSAKAQTEPASADHLTTSATRSGRSGQALSLEERADIFLARKAYADAVDYYHRALKQGNYENALLWNKLGISYQLEMDYREARKAYKEASHRKVDFAEPWNNLGTTYFLTGKYRKSLKYYQSAIKLSPTNASFHMNLGASYSKMKKYPEAIEQYRAALELDPNVLTEHSSAAAVLEARGTDVEFYFYLAKVFASLARPEESVRYLRRALEDGFKDLKRLDDDPDFRKISKYPAYVELLKRPPVAIPD